MLKIIITSVTTAVPRDVKCQRSNPVLLKQHRSPLEVAWKSPAPAPPRSCQAPLSRPFGINKHCHLMAGSRYCTAAPCHWKAGVKASGFFAKEVSVTNHKISFFPTQLYDDFLMMKILFSQPRTFCYSVILWLSSRKEIAFMFAILKTLFIPQHCVSSFSLETGWRKLLLCSCFFLLWAFCGVAHSHSDKQRVIASETSLSACAVVLGGWHLWSAMLLLQVAVCLVLGQTPLLRTVVVYFSCREWSFHSPLCPSGSGLCNRVSASPL